MISIAHLIIFLETFSILTGQDLPSCGHISNLDSLTKPNSKVPWAVRLINQEETTWLESVFIHPGILVSPTQVLLSARLFYRPDTSNNLLFRIHKSNGSYAVLLNDGSSLNISHLTLHPKTTNLTECNMITYEFLLAHLVSPVKVSEFVQPICMKNSTHTTNTGLFTRTNSSIFGLQWIWSFENHAYTIRQLGRFSHENCEAISSSNHFYNQEGLQCSPVKIDETAKIQEPSVWIHRNKSVNSAVFECTDSTCFLHGTLVMFIYRFLRGGCTHKFNESVLYMWSIDDKLNNWIERNEQCGSSNFTCASDGKCIELSKLCDNKVDCNDSSDEIHEYCQNSHLCKDDQFRCRVYGKCIPTSKIRDGTPDCLDGQDEEETKGQAIRISLVAGVVVGLFAVVLVYSFLRIRRLKKEIRDLTEEEINEFFQGTIDSRRSNLLHSRNEDRIYESRDYINGSLLAKPWDDIFEISLKQLQLGDELGRGEFGIVYKADMKSFNNLTKQMSSVEVAAKTQLPHMNVDEFKNLLREIKIMSQVGSHDCIVCFIGASTQNIKKRQVHLVMEFCSNGNLLGFLRRLKSKTELEDVRLSGPYVAHTRASRVITNRVQDFYKWAIQIARGMEFLESSHVIHGDLAARNVLLTEYLDAKISDFGLARELDKTSIYVKSTQQAIPWKWLALESLKSNVYSYKTDVWSYGVTLWEIFSLGTSPYENIRFSAEFLEALEKGNRLPRPEFATMQLYYVMNLTWEADPEMRPTFSFLQSLLVEMQGTRNSVQCIVRSN